MLTSVTQHMKPGTLVPQGVLWALQVTAMAWNKPALVLCGTLDMGGCSQESWGSWKQC